MQTELPYTDTRPLRDVVTTNTERTFVAPQTLSYWEGWRRFVQERILAAAGLLPAPSRCSLKPRVFQRIERDGYAIETVGIQTLPGFYLYGNLYRPLPMPSTPKPAVLIAHGHWEQGRLTDTEEASFPACGIAMARAGWTAFAYDMVGYTDTTQVSHGFGANPQCILWGISLFGLQTWNSLRALDFMRTLPQVDPHRIGMVGASGGGTQTMMLAALDNRLFASAPCVMVSHTMQGGCLCENAPGLRVDFSNLDVAACHAPQPQILVAAAGDWTKTTLIMEGPSIATIYRLYRADSCFRYLLLDYGHNFNRKSRKAVYSFFCEQFGEKRVSMEQLYTKETEEALRVPLAVKPKGLDEERLTTLLQRNAIELLTKGIPQNRKDLPAFRRQFRPLWKHILAVEEPNPSQIAVAYGSASSISGGSARPISFGRLGRGDRVEGWLLEPHLPRSEWGGVLFKSPSEEEDAPLIDPMEERLLRLGLRLLRLRPFAPFVPGAESRYAHYTKDFYTTYNRTWLQEQMQDVFTAFACLYRLGCRHVLLLGEGEGGLNALLCAPEASIVVAEGDLQRMEREEYWLGFKRFLPGVMRMGGALLPLALAAPRPVFVWGVEANEHRWRLPEMLSPLYGESLLLLREKPKLGSLVEWIERAMRQIGREDRGG